MIVATAGHVDHGKTCLVKALTGIDTDTLAEEKKRGLSIDIGFAYLPLDAATSIGFIDVPGHERFIKNALCGLTAANAVLLVVAADDGLMPQTREHLAVIDLLGFRCGAVVISKIDRVASARVEQVRQELQAECLNTAVRDWPVFALSTVSAMGVASLQQWLLEQAHLASIPLPSNNSQSAASMDDDAGEDHLFRMPIDRVFEIRGAGLVVTGTVIAGRVMPEDIVSIDAAGQALRVRGLRVHDEASECGRRGQRCAINLSGSGLGKLPIRRGCWVTATEVAAPVERFDAHIRLVNDSPRPLRHWTPVHLHLGAAETGARVAVLEGASIAAGQQGLVQLVCKRPLGASFGDSLIIRDQSARHTLGGGRVLDIFAPLRGRAQAQRLQWLRQMDRESATEAMRRLLTSSASGVNLAQFAANRNLGRRARSRVEQAVAPIVLELEGHCVGFAESVIVRHEACILAGLQACHQAQPDAAEFSPEALRMNLAVKLSAALLRALIERLRRQGQLRVNGSHYALQAQPAKLGATDRAHWQAIESALAANGLRPMTLDELMSAMQYSTTAPKPLIERQIETGQIVRLSPRLLLLPEQLQALQQLVERLQADAGDGLFSVAQFRDASGIGRNRCIEILECLDARGITRRSGQGRCLLPRAQDQFARMQSHQ